MNQSRLRNHPQSPYKEEYWLLNNLYKLRRRAQGWMIPTRFETWVPHSWETIPRCILPSAVASLAISRIHLYEQIYLNPLRQWAPTQVWANFRLKELLSFNQGSDHRYGLSIMQWAFMWNCILRVMQWAFDHLQGNQLSCLLCGGSFGLGLFPAEYYLIERKGVAMNAHMHVKVVPLG